MRKLFSLLLFVFAFSSVRAQVLPDSTVMFKAFWNQGDSYSYNFEYKRLRVNKDGDTTAVFSMGGIRTLTVVSADE